MRPFLFLSKNFHPDITKGLFCICNVVTPSHHLIRQKFKTYTPQGDTPIGIKDREAADRQPRAPRARQTKQPTREHRKQGSTKQGSTRPGSRKHPTSQHKKNKEHMASRQGTSGQHSRTRSTTQPPGPPISKHKHRDDTGQEPQNTSPQQLTTGSTNNAASTTNNPGTIQQVRLMNHTQTSHSLPGKPASITHQQGRTLAPPTPEQPA
jgi:hypothetical protein